MSIASRLKDITHIPDKYRTPYPPVPKSAKIELTPTCNYKCQYCAICFRNGQVMHDMSWELFTRITKEMSELGVEEIGVFYIGESFCKFDLLLKAVKYLKHDLGVPYVFLTSNASLATKDKVEKLMQAGLDSLKWSCNAADDEQFTQLMGVSKALFTNARRNIKDAFAVRNEGNYATRLYASSVHYDEAQPNRMEEILKDIVPYVDEHYWLPLYSAGGKARDKERAMGWTPVAGNIGRLDMSVDPLPCWTIFTGAHIRWDGTMTACCLDGTGYWQMGDLKTQSFMEAWHSDEFIKLRKAHLELNVKNTKCEKCALYGS